MYLVTTFPCSDQTDKTVPEAEVYLQKCVYFHQLERDLVL